MTQQNLLDLVFISPIVVAISLVMLLICKPPKTVGGAKNYRLGIVGLIICFAVLFLLGQMAKIFNAWLSDVNFAMGGFFIGAVLLRVANDALLGKKAKWIVKE